MDETGTTAYPHAAGGQLWSEDLPAPKFRQAGGLWSNDTVANSFNHRFRMALSLTQPTGRWTNITSPSGTLSHQYLERIPWRKAG